MSTHGYIALAELAAEAAKPPAAIDVLLGQCGAQPWTEEGGPQRLADWLRPELTAARADLVILSELATTPFFSVSTDRRWLQAGVLSSGEELGPLAALASEFSVYIVIPFAERAGHGELYNSALLMGPDGRPITGTYCTGPERGRPTVTYRKVHLSENRNTVPGVHEKYFFRPGTGFVTYETRFGRLTVLICYDRSFPEAWRAVQRAGARIVAVPVASSRPERAAMFGRELQVAAMQHGQWVLAASKGGKEIDDSGGAVTYFGSSQVVSPFGETLVEGPLAGGPDVLRSRIDLTRLADYDATYHLARDRRPDAYE